jgi:acetyl esterase/lipase
MLKAFVFALSLVASTASAAEIYTSPPDKPDPSKTYVFYLHGKIIEEKGPRPIDTRFGLYDYPAVLDAVASRGAVVISAQRPKDTDMAAYAGAVVGQVERLVEAGVPENHIAVVGFSKGGGIAARVSSFLRRKDVRFVLLAACWDAKQSPIRLTGRVLSIRESSDTLVPQSCRAFAEQAEKPTSFDEIVISTGKSHGAFYLPREVWTKPTLDFIHGDVHAKR